MCFIQVQERLIKNKTLLTTIEPTVSCTSLEVSLYLTDILFFHAKL
jgi:hypothetical protein